MSENKSTVKQIHPGIILLEEFLEPMDISQYRFAKIKLIQKSRKKFIPGIASL